MRTSIREYTEAVRGQYLGASKMKESRILDEFTKVVGCHSALLMKSEIGDVKWSAPL